MQQDLAQAIPDATRQDVRFHVQGETCVAWRELLSIARQLEDFRAAVGKPGEFALMSAPDCLPGYGNLVAPEVQAAGRWRNRVCARIGLAIPFYAPGAKLARSRVPVFVAVAEQDSIAPAGPTVRAARNNPRVELERYPLGHFDHYPEPDSRAGANFELVVADELAFLRKHLLAP